MKRRRLEDVSTTVWVPPPDFTFEPGDNPYLTEYKKYNGGISLQAYQARWDLVPHFGFAVPDEPSLQVLATHGPIVEMGAGTGYWARLLRDRGVEVRAFDRTIPDGNKSPYDFQRTWTQVEVGTPESLSEFEDYTLFLCWPPYDSPMAADCLEYWHGDLLVVVGEGRGGCTAEDGFFDLLDRDFVQWESFPVPRWRGMNDYMDLYHRK